MTSQALRIEHAGVGIALRRWGHDAPGKPVALLVHGTGFVAEVWDELAAGLAGTHVVYAIDRRGHGRSDKPGPDGYRFDDFASDVIGVLQALDLSQVLGVGHSAGATDLLLAAGRRPRGFAGLFAMEPTIMDPRSARPPGTSLGEASQLALQRAPRRRAIFDHPDAARERLRAAESFAHWTSASLSAYLAHGFESLDDGRVRLRCTPEIEAAMLRPIFEAMEQIHAGDPAGNPFLSLAEIACPVRIAAAERSPAIYADMAARARALIPHASQATFAGAGHCVVQEQPQVVLAAVQAFAAEIGRGR